MVPFGGNGAGYVARDRRSSFRRADTEKNSDFFGFWNANKCGFLLLNVNNVQRTA